MCHHGSTGGEAKDWKATTFNARIEEARDKPAFRAVWRRGRCLILVGGFYEWTGPKGDRRPNLILPAGNEETLFFAGLASRWRDLLIYTYLTRIDPKGGKWPGGGATCQPKKTSASGHSSSVQRIKRMLSALNLHATSL